MRILLSLGSNVEPQIHLPACVKQLKQHFPSLKVSSYYETDPVGPSGPEQFWNAASFFETDLNEKHVREIIHEIESRLGRIRDPSNKFLPRTIDLDLLPQPGYTEHAFIMIPLAEILPEQKDAESGKTFSEIAEELEKKKESVRKIQGLK